MAKQTKKGNNLAVNTDGQAYDKPKTFSVNGKDYYFLHSGEEMWYGGELVSIDDVLANEEYLKGLVASESCLVKEIKPAE